MRRPDRPCVCPRFQHAAELVGRRWTAAVIWVALEGPARFGEIRRSVPGLSARMLAERLRELEAEGLLARQTRSGDPQLTEYALTSKGRALAGVVRALEEWVAAWDPPGARAHAPASASREPGPEARLAEGGGEAAPSR